MSAPDLDGLDPIGPKWGEDYQRRHPEPEQDVPPWRRDVGPFTDSTQAMRQYEAQMHGIPAEIVRRVGPVMVLNEAALLAGLELTDHERAVISGTVPAEAAVILAGLIIRARHDHDGTGSARRADG